MLTSVYSLQRENPRQAAQKRLKGISGLVGEEGESTDSTAKATLAATLIAANSVQTVDKVVQSAADSLSAEEQ